eukprot:gene6158-8173_t
MAIGRPAENIMAWTTPAAIDLRFGFEITMYIANRNRRPDHSFNGMDTLYSGHPISPP